MSNFPQFEILDIVKFVSDERTNSLFKKLDGIQGTVLSINGSFYTTVILKAETIENIIHHSILSQRTNSHYIFSFRNELLVKVSNPITYE